MITWTLDTKKDQKRKPSLLYGTEVHWVLFRLFVWLLNWKRVLPSKTGGASWLGGAVWPVSSLLNYLVLFFIFFPARTLPLAPTQKCSRFPAPTMVSEDRKETGLSLPSAAQKMRKARFLRIWFRSNLTEKKKPRFSTASLVKEPTHLPSVCLWLKEKQGG